MSIEITRLRRSSFGAARRFAITGMHLHWYTGNAIELYAYSQYFWNLEIARATRALGAYEGDRLVGVLLLDVPGEPKVFRSRIRDAFVRLAEWVVSRTHGAASSEYDAANRRMLDAFLERDHSDAELNFFAVDPAIVGKGVGSRLLDHLERLADGKRVHLFTDSGSTYQFYERRGFTEEGREDVVLDVASGRRPLTCLLFSKTLSSPNP